jgi:hypothetical protein
VRSVSCGPGRVAPDDGEPAVLDLLAERLGLIYGSDWSDEVERLLLRPDEAASARSLDAALALVEELTGALLPSWLLPVAWVDEESLACLVIDVSPGVEIGEVRRLHLRAVPTGQQLALLDVDPLLYVASLEEELASRAEGHDRILDVIGPAYEASYIDHEKRPRDFVVRPVRIACQNVIVGLAAITQDSNFDGLSVPAWQTCEVPHVATHEANRALAALMLCDAFQNGGTMEVRFDRRTAVTLPDRTVTYESHPEGQVPASLRRYGRTVGVQLGADDPASISPREARDLFLAVTPMPPDLRRRVVAAAETAGVAPERACFALLSQTWREVEIDFLLACSGHAGSSLEGGAEWIKRGARQAEMEECRAALMAGMYFRRLNGRDNAGTDAGGVRVVEDVSAGIEWEVLPESGAVVFSGCDLTDGVPWLSSGQVDRQSEIALLPRSLAMVEAATQLHELRHTGLNAVIALPLDVPVPDSWGDLPVLRCPDRRADLDLTVEGKLLTSRISRG